MLKEQPLITDVIGDKTTKTDVRIEFFGATDELSANIMHLSHYIEDVKLQMELKKIVNLLSVMMAEVAGGFGHIGQRHLDELLELVDKYEKIAGALQGLCRPRYNSYGFACTHCAYRYPPCRTCLCQSVRKIRRQRLHIRISQQNVYVVLRHRAYLRRTVMKFFIQFASVGTADIVEYL